MRRLATRSVMLVGLLALAGCSSINPTPSTSVHQPMSARPMPATPDPAQVNGSIFAAGGGRGLFEDRRAARVGDLITVTLAERTNATKQANTSTERESTLTGGLTNSSGLPVGGLKGLNIEAGVQNDFSGTGSSAANNTFNGTITVTVIEVFANGNLLVSGEKMLSINQGNEFIRFSGVVNPVHLSASNTVQSTQVADARMEYKGSGIVDEANTMGWMQRFFTAILPF